MSRRCEEHSCEICRAKIPVQHEVNRFDYREKGFETIRRTRPHYFCDECADKIMHEIIQKIKANI